MWMSQQKMDIQSTIGPRFPDLLRSSISIDYVKTVCTLFRVFFYFCFLLSSTLVAEFAPADGSISSKSYKYIQRRLRAK